MKPLSKETAQIFKPIDIESDNWLRLTLNNELDKFTMDLWRQYPNSDATRYHQNYKYSPAAEVMTFVTRIPERKKVTTGYAPVAFEIPATDYTCEVINSLWPQDQIEFHDEDTRAKFDEILQRSALADLCAEVTAKWKDRKEVPQHQYEYCEAEPLSPYQQVAMVNSLHSPGYGLFMEQGVGKTPVAIATICNAAKYLQEWQIAQHDGKDQPQRMYYGLIVCPNNVRLNWQKEFEKFATQPGKITVLRGPEVGRVCQMIDATAPMEGALYSIVICGYETLSRSWEALQMVPWDIAVLDESHGIKSTKTKRFKTSLLLRDRSAQRMVLTGTPIANSALDIYAQLEFMGKGYSGFSSFEHFKQFYGVYEVTETGHRALTGLQNLPFMQERLARYSFIISKAEALPDLPPKQYDIYEVEMGTDQAEYYREIRTKLALEIESDLADNSQPRSMVINNVLTKLLRLTQITSGFVSWGETFNEVGELLGGKRIEYFSPNPKIEALREINKEKGPNNKTIVWGCFTPDIEYMKAWAEADGLDYVCFTGATSFDERIEAERRFNFDRNCRWFFGNAAAGGVGLNLLGYPPGAPEGYDTNCDHIIYYSQNWSAISRGQSEDRANRRGTRVPTRITDLVVPQTIDEEIRARVVDKKLHAMQVSDLRLILKNVLSDILE